MPIALQTIIWAVMAGGSGVVLSIAIDKRSVWIGWIAMFMFAAATDLMPDFY